LFCYFEVYPLNVKDAYLLTYLGVVLFFDALLPTARVSGKSLGRVFGGSRNAFA
jgi:hypothetical protein